MKTCRKCQTEKPLTDFYKHAFMRDGYLNICIVCKRQDAIKRRAENIEAARAYDRHRYRTQPQRLAAIMEYQKTERGKQAHAKAIRRFIEKNPEKRKAHVILGNALRDGRLKKQPCLLCDSKEVHAHHEDYSKPLDVTWLCAKHHKEIHKMPETLSHAIA